MYTVHVRLAGFFTLYPSNVFFSLRVFFARTWTLAYGRSALLLCYNPYARVRTVISVLPRISAAPFPLMNIFSISSHLSKINQSLIHPTFPSHTRCTITLTLGVSHRLCCFHIFSVSLLPVVPAGASFKPLGTTIFLCSASLLHCPHHNPHTFFPENFTRTQFPHFSPHPRLYHQANVK